MISSILGNINSINTSNEIYNLLNKNNDENPEDISLENNLKEKKEKALKLVKEKTGLIEFNGKTDAYWKDLETADTKVMVLSIPDGTFIRSANDLKQELSAQEINGSFLILDGLAYKSNTDYESIVYMKV